MAITGKFQADFADFDAAAQKSERQLASFQAAGAHVEVQLGRIETASRDAAPPVNDLRHSVGQVDSALRNMGIEVPREVRGLADLQAASGRTAGALGAVAKAGSALGVGMAAWKVTRAAMEFFQLDGAVAGAWTKLLGFGDAAAEVAAHNADVLARASKTAGVEITGLSTAMAINAGTIGDWRSNAEKSATTVTRWQGELAKVTAAGDMAALTADLASQNFALKDLAARYHVSIEALQFFTREQAATAKAVTEANAAIEASNAKKLAALDAELEERAAVRKVEERALLELTKLEEQYNLTRVEQGGTANELLIQQIKSWEQVTAAAFRKAGIVGSDAYAQLHKNAKQALDGIGVDWAFLRANSIETLQETARNARATYDAMINGSMTFTREVLDAQLEKTRAAEDAARDMGRSFVQAFDVASVGSKQLEADLEAVAKAAEKANRLLGNSLTYDLSTPEGMADFKKKNPGATVNASMEYFLTHTLQDAVMAGLVNFYGGFAPGFAGGVTNFVGGPAIVGERGPELVTLPRGSNVIPIGRGIGGGSVHVGSINVTLNYPIMRDRQAMQEIGQIFGDAVIERARAQGVRFGSRS